MSHAASEVLRVSMPGAFARLGPALAQEFSAATGHAVALTQFRPSGLLAADILAGVQADVYVSANVQWMRRLQRAGVVRRWTTLAGNRLCLITRPNSGVERLLDLVQPHLRVVAPQAATDPCGRYVELSWRSAGILPTMRAKEAAGELLRSIGSGDLPAYVLDRRVEVGMLYLTEARHLDSERVRIVELPSDQDLHDCIRFVVAALTPPGEPFVRWLLEPPAQARLDAAGFLKRLNHTMPNASHPTPFGGHTLTCHGRG